MWNNTKEKVLSNKSDNLLHKNYAKSTCLLFWKWFVNPVFPRKKCCSLCLIHINDEEEHAELWALPSL